MESGSHFYFILLSLLLHLEFSTQLIPEEEELKIENMPDSRSYSKYVHNITLLLKPSVSPCEDFHEFVCGRENTNDAHDMTWTSWSDHLREKYLKWLEEDITSKDEGIVKQIKREYRMCMDVNRGTKNLDSLLSLVDGDIGWPMISTQWGIPHMLPILFTQKYESSLLSVRVKNKEIHISLDEVSPYGVITGVQSLRGIVISKDQLKNYREDIERIIQIIARHKNIDLPFNQITDDINEVMKFRENLQMVVQNTYYWLEKNEPFNMTVGMLKTTLQPSKSNVIKLDWHRFLDSLFKNVDNFVVQDDTPVYADAYALREFVYYMITTTPRIIVNHLKLHMFESYMKYTTEEMNEIYKRMVTNLNYKNYPQERNRMCMDEPHFSRALEYKYLQKEFPESFRRAGNRMVDKLKNTLRRQIQASRWMNITQMAALSNLDRIRVIVGVEDKYFNHAEMETYYQYSSTEDYLETLRNARHRLKDIEYSSIAEDSDDILGDSFASRTELIRKPRNALIMIPLGYMHEHNLSPKTPAIFSYASLGRIISALLNQFIVLLGFDQRKFKGKLNVRIWRHWYHDENTTQGMPLYDCFRNQYDKRSDHLGWIPFYDSSIMRYSMYDQMAAFTVYETYKEAVSGDAMEEKFLSKHQLNDRLLFTAMGNKFCMNNGWMEEYYVEDSRSTEYQTKKNRLNKMVSNMESFARTFECITGTPMNPVRKCSFWIS